MFCWSVVAFATWPIALSSFQGPKPCAPTPSCSSRVIVFLIQTVMIFKLRSFCVAFATRSSRYRALKVFKPLSRHVIRLIESNTIFNIIDCSNCVRCFSFWLLRSRHGPRALEPQGPKQLSSHALRLFERNITFNTNSNASQTAIVFSCAFATWPYRSLSLKTLSP